MSLVAKLHWGQGRRTWVTGSRHPSQARWERHYRSSVAVPPGSESLWRELGLATGAWRALFRKRPEAFWEMPSVSGIRCCTRTHLKMALCRTRLVGGTYDKYQQSYTGDIVLLVICDTKLLFFSLTGHWQDRVFANAPGNLGSIPCRVISKTQKNGTWCRLA